MKKITIPECRNPFVVIVNGKRYEYGSGQEIEVPDEVAEAIQFHVDSKPKALPIPEGGSGGEIDSEQLGEMNDALTDLASRVEALENGGGSAKLYAHYLTLNGDFDNLAGHINAYFMIVNSDPTKIVLLNGITKGIEEIYAAGIPATGMINYKNEEHVIVGFSYHEDLYTGWHFVVTPSVYIEKNNMEFSIIAVESILMEELGLEYYIDDIVKELK